MQNPDEPSGVSTTEHILRNYYQSIYKLEEYLHVLIATNRGDSPPPFLPSAQDSPEYHQLLRKTIVATKSSQPPAPCVISQPLLHMDEMLNIALGRLFQAQNPKNILATGFHPARLHEDNVKMVGRQMVGVDHTNTVHAILNSQEWNTLLQRIGIEAMLHLLLNTSMFISLPNDCLYQITGEGLTYLKSHQPPASTPVTGHKRKLNHFTFTEKARKRRKTSETPLGSRANSFTSPNRNQYEERTPADIQFPRHRLFYSQAPLLPRTKTKTVGLPPNHILNRIQPSYGPSAEAVKCDLNPRQEEADARLLSKYVFPRQYDPTGNKLSSPFTSDVKDKRYDDRDAEIRDLGCTKMPKRLREALPLLRRVVRKHGKCHYKALLNRACPSKLKPHISGDPDVSSLLDFLADDPSHALLTQAAAPDITLGSLSDRSTGRLLRQAEMHAINKPPFAEYACTQYEVFRYAALVTKHVFPVLLWGSKKNSAVLLSHVHRFVQRRRMETLTLHDVLQGFCIADCDWTSSAGVHSARSVSMTDNLKRLELVQDLMFWYFDSFLIPLLRTTFYATESSAFGKKVLYFRHDDWHTLCNPLIDRLTHDTFRKLEPEEVAELQRQKTLGVSFVRLLPKEAGVRPIVNLKKRTRNGVKKKSVNDVLQAAFQILTYEKNLNPMNLGATIGKFNTDFYRRLRAFKVALSRDNGHGKLPKLYFVKLDVKACFDTIPQDKLLRILIDIISEPKYRIHTFATASSVRGVPRQQFTKRFAHPSTPDNDQETHFLRHASMLAQTLKSTIFVDKVKYQDHNREDILKLLHEHIEENTVKIGKDYYRQVVGIPQGSILSTLLCCFCYGDMEKRYFDFSQDPTCFLSRYVDDYLLVTTDLQKAKSFLSMMKKGHPEYGCFINPDKTATNFDSEDNIANVLRADLRDISWCGYLINMADLSVTVDYTRYELDVANRLTVSCARQPAKVFGDKMLYPISQATLRSHPIYCDLSLNGETVVYINTYQAFLMTAMKCTAYLETLRIDITKATGAGVIARKIKELVAQTRGSILCKEFCTVTGRYSKMVTQRNTITWLGFHAFRQVFRRHSTKFALVLRRLELELGRTKYRGVSRCYGGVTRRGMVENGMSGVLGEEMGGR